MRKVEPGCIEATVEATSFRAAIKAYQEMFGDEITFIMTPTGFCFGACHKDKQFQAIFDSENLLGYGYYLRHENETTVPEYTFKTRATALISAEAFQTVDKKKSVSFYVDINEDLSINNNKLKLKYTDGNAVTPVAAEYIEPIIFDNHLTTIYKGKQPNCIRRIDFFCKAMTTGIVKKSRSFVEFRLKEDGDVLFVWKDKAEPLTNNDNHADSGTFSTSQLSRVIDFLPEPSNKVVHTITILGNDNNGYKCLEKISNLSVVQCYMAKNAPIVFRIALNTQGHIVVAYNNYNNSDNGSPAPGPTVKRGGRTAATARKEVDK